MRKILPKKAILVPEEAECVFHGEIFEVYHWEQQLFDGESANFEMLKRPDSMQVIAVRDDKIVVLDDAQPNRPAMLCLPGGRPEKTDESWLAASKRELLEETGMTFRCWRLIDVEQPIRKIEWFGAVYLALDFDAQGEQSLDPGGEEITIRYVSFDEFRTIVFGGNEPKLSYLKRLLLEVHSLEELCSLPQFQGTLVDRD